MSNGALSGAADTGGLSGVDAETLEPMVRDLLGDPTAVVEGGWSCRPLGGGGGEGLGLYRVTGSARIGRDSHPWALVVKVSAAADGTDPAAYDYPAREGLAYGSGLLATLPGELAAPRCVAVATQLDGTTRLWLEAVTDEHPGPWPLDRYALVARQLGRFTGAYLTGEPLPDQPWLSRGWLRDLVERSGSVVAELELLAGLHASLLARQLYPPSVTAELRRLWEERARYLATLDQLPQTFCHHDAFRRNLLHRGGLGGEELVAVDWAYAGLGAVGEELVPLVIGSLAFFEAEGIGPPDLDATCFASYMAGLREVGWAGGDHLVRLGFTAAGALRYTLGTLPLEVSMVTDPAVGLDAEAMFGRPLEEVVEALAELWPYQLGLAKEARMLLPGVG
jgi:hypothetical protein